MSRPTKPAEPTSERERGQCETKWGKMVLHPNTGARYWCQADSWLDGYDLILRLGDFC